ncbi:hypothetical protein I3842_15G074500 [Carya illinoinensis]|uniref:Uncharacterized protein n=1 Tax=Carya illinoinensis TaxID=32201 RepID=A0A922D6W3_CARIL|nr:hypothetical protein I3842_15G074500 [Carya illinoinensis]
MIYFRLEQWKRYQTEWFCSYSFLFCRVYTFLISYIRWCPSNFRILNDYTSAGNSERPWIFCVFISDDIFSFGDSKEVPN